MIVCVTCGEECHKLIGEGVEEDVERFFTHEEADTQMLLHAANVTRFGYEAIIISSIDTDVRVLCLAFCTEIQTPIFQKCCT